MVIEEKFWMFEYCQFTEIQFFKQKAWRHALRLATLPSNFAFLHYKIVIMYFSISSLCKRQPQQKMSRTMLAISILLILVINKKAKNLRYSRLINLHYLSFILYFSIFYSSILILSRTFCTTNILKKLLKCL